MQTPALFLDLDAFERNLQWMAEAMRGSGVALRPHAKSHQCPEIAKAQMALGAVGVCCQTVHEAAALIETGIPDVLVTNEIVGEQKLRTLATIARWARVAVLADNDTLVADLALAASAGGAELRVLVEIVVCETAGTVRDDQDVT